MTSPMPARPARPSALILVLGPAVVLALAALTESVSDDIAIANAALILAVVTVVAGSIRWDAGLATSVAAAFGLNYFHTEPVHSLRVTSREDLISILLLGGLGLVVSATTALRVRRTVSVRDKRAVAEHRAQLRRLLSTSQPVIDVWHTTIDAASAGIALLDVRIDEHGAASLPVVARRASPVDDGDVGGVVVIPESGAVVAFAGSEGLGHLVVTPHQGVGAVELDRRVLLEFADHLSLALTADVEGSVGGLP